MKIKIYKEIVEGAPVNTWITVPGGRIVSVGLQNGKMCLWYTVCEEQPDLHFQYKIVGTGWEFDWDCYIVGSVIDDPFVWHVLERKGNKPD